MKKNTILSAFLLLLSSLLMQAQTYDISSLSSSDIGAGGDAQWSFERYSYSSEEFSVLTMYADSGRINFRDVSNPERYQGVLIGDADASDESSYAVKRNSWYDAKDEYVYIGEDLEVYSQMFANAAIVFTVPADGYYKVEASVLREDGWKETPLKAVFRYRYDGETEVKSLATLGFDFDFGEGAFNTDTLLVDESGDMLKWIKQDEASGTFYLNATAGSKITFEVDCQNYGYDSDYSGREVWSRTKWTNLVVTTSTESEATAAENYMDPYDTGYETEFLTAYGTAADVLNNAMVGDGQGEYPQAAFNEFESTINEIYSYYENGKVNILNVAAYVAMLEDATEEFESQVNLFDWTLDYNYRLFPYDEDDTEAAEVHNNIFSKDVASPWNFMAYTVSSGEYTDCQNYDKNGKMTSYDAWYDGSGEWFYISVSGSVHPTVSKSPAIVFEAPEDGIYRVGATVYRESPNVNVVNEMWARFRFIPNGETAVDKETSMGLDKAYGLPTDNYPVTADFYVKLQTGDRITFEEDCYTANRNSSAGSMWQRLYVATLQGTTAEIEADIDADTLTYINPYVVGDFTELQALVNTGDSLLSAVTIGSELGQYTQENADVLSSAVASADSMVNANEAGQAYIDSKYNELADALGVFLESINVSTDAIADGYYYIKVKDENGDFLYLTDWIWEQPEDNNALDSIYPIFVSKIDTNDVMQLFKISMDDDVSRYRIDSKYRLDNSGAFSTTFVNEKGTFSVNSYSSAWNSFTMKYNGTSYAYQQGGKAGSSYLTVGEKTFNSEVLQKLAISSESGMVDNFIFYLEAAYSSATEQELAALLQAINNADSVLNNTTEGTELGQFTTEVRKTLSDLKDSATVVYNTSGASSTEVSTATADLEEGILTYLNSFNHSLNTIDLGYYYVKIQDDNGDWLYLTDSELIDPQSSSATDTIFPTFLEKRTEDVATQLFRFAIDTSVTRVRIDSKSRLEDSESFATSYVGEAAKFGYNAYSAAWNTYNLYSDGSKYAIQRAGSAGSTFWYPADVDDYKRILTDDENSAYDNLYFVLEYVSEAPELTAVSEIATLDVKMWGANGVINIKGASNGDMIQVYNMMGRCVASANVNSNLQSVSVNSGIYIVRLSGKSNTAMKVVVY